MRHTAPLVRQSDWLRQLIGHTRDSTSRFNADFHRGADVVAAALAAASADLK